VITAQNNHTSNWQRMHGARKLPLPGIWPEAEVLKKLRPAYSHDPDSLIAASHVVAVHFQTIAAANNYWRDD
jgi:hypothetical protein